jgi:hypothetical protein
MEDIFTMKKLIISVAMLALLAVFALALQQTGNLIVTVTSEEGQTLPGASITLTSNVLMGSRTQATGANGKATFRNLPPGDYNIEVVMDGFDAYRQTGIEIRLAKTAKFDVTLKLGQAREVVEVVGTGPIVDTTSNTIASQFDFDTFINHMPTARSYAGATGIASLSAGVVGANNPSSGGGGDNANLYALDGVSHMDPRTHTWSGQFNIDAVADVSIITAGGSAEYGHAMGMILNMVTKSGSNDVTGLARLEMTRVNWNDLSEKNPATAADNVRQGQDNDAWNYTVGGPLYPDVVWWYFGYYPSASETVYNRFLDPFNPTIGVPAIRTYDGHFMNIKGTIQLGEDIKLSGFYREDPILIANINSFRADYLGPYCLPSADVYQSQGGKGYMGGITYVVSPEMFVEAMWTSGRNPLELGNQGTDPDGRFIPGGTTGPFFSSDDGWFWGTYQLDYNSQRNHDTYKGAVNYLVESESIGEHDIKFGVEFLDNWTNVASTYYPTNEFVSTSAVSGVGFDNVQWIYRYTYENRLPAVETHNKTWTVFLQDSMQISDALTINAGVRTDIASLYDNYNDSIHDDGIFTALAPRLGFAYDMEGILLRGSVGRYYDVYVTYMIDDFTYFTTPETKNYWAPTDGVDGRNGWSYVRSTYRGTADILNTIDPDLHPSYMDEATVGMDYMFSDTLAVSLTGMFKDYKAFVSRQDPDGDQYYNWTNLETPAYGLSSKTYLGAILELRKRPTEDNLFLNASLTYQDSQGLTANENNLRTTWYQTPWHNDTNIERYWGDIAGFNWFAKAQATYFFPNNWYVGLIANWTQGFARSSTRLINYGGYTQIVDYPNGRADMEREPDRFVLSLQFGMEQTIEVPFDIPLWDDTLQLGIYANINNMLNNESEINTNTNLASAAYGRATTWPQARNYLLGFRIEL